ncbi:MAG TPA: hypothetical protein V6D03_14635, partial [Candidatus Caenarcaniphilales bacterium]
MRLLRSPQTLQHRFIFGLGVMLLPLVALGFGTLLALEGTSNAFEKCQQETSQVIFPLMRLQTLIVKASIGADDYLIDGDPAERDRFRQLSQEVDKAFQVVSAAAPFEMGEEQTIVRSAQQEWQQAQRVSETLLAHPRAVRDQTIAQDRERFDNHTNKAVASLDQVYTLAQRELAHYMDQAQAVKQWGIHLISIVLGVGLGTAVMAGLA